MGRAILHPSQLSCIASQLRVVAHHLEHTLPAQLRQMDAMIVAGEREIARLQQMLDGNSSPSTDHSLRQPDILPFDRVTRRTIVASASQEFGDEPQRRVA